MKIGWERKHVNSLFSCMFLYIKILNQDLYIKIQKQVAAKSRLGGGDARQYSIRITCSHDTRTPSKDNGLGEIFYTHHLLKDVSEQRQRSALAILYTHRLPLSRTHVWQSAITNPRVAVNRQRTHFRYGLFIPIFDGGWVSRMMKRGHL